MQGCFELNSVKKLLLAITLSLFLALPSFAASFTTYNITGNLKSAEAYRYKVGGGEWLELPKNCTGFTLQDVGESDLYLQYKAGGEWSESVKVASDMYEKDAPVDITITIDLDDYGRYEYGGEWIDIDKENPTVTLSGLIQGEDNAIPLELSLDGEEWIKQEDIIIKPYLIDIELNVVKPKRFYAKGGISPYSIGIYDFYKGHSIADSRAITMSQYGFTTSLDFGYRFNKVFGLFLTGDYTYIRKKASVIPDGFNWRYASIALGAECRLFEVKSFKESCSVFAGAMLHMNSNEGQFSSFVGIGLTSAIRFSKSVSLTIDTKAKAAWLNNSEPLYRSLTYIIDTAAIGMEVRF